MKNEERLIEVMTELLAEVHEMRKDISGTRGDINDMRKDISGMREDMVDMKREQSKTNLEIQELRLSVMKLADFNERIFRLEKEVFRKAS